jgi:hypothetical protein
VATAAERTTTALKVFRLVIWFSPIPVVTTNSCHHTNFSYESISPSPLNSISETSTARDDRVILPAVSEATAHKFVDDRPQTVCRNIEGRERDRQLETRWTRCVSEMIPILNVIEMKKGGHFAAMEQAAALANEIQQFFRQLR